MGLNGPSIVNITLLITMSLFVMLIFCYVRKAAREEQSPVHTGDYYNRRKRRHYSRRIRWLCRWKRRLEIGDYCAIGHGFKRQCMHCVQPKCEPRVDIQWTGNRHSLPCNAR